MDNFWIVTLFQIHLSSEKFEHLKLLALEQFNGIGIEEYSLSEAEVDEILGERSYSGGDLPMEVLDEVDLILSGKPINIRTFFNQEIEAKGFFEIVRSQFLCEAQIECRHVEDWNLEWKKHYSPIVVDENFLVLPSWINENFPNRYILKINPGMGFGTGSHETTFLCLQLFSQFINHGELKSVLDFGSGSGILGIAALKTNDSLEVDFYDIDLEANKNCDQNIQLNDLVQSKYRLLLPEYRSYLQPSYSMIFANILQNILIEEAKFLTSLLHKGGHIILSGLLNHQVDLIIELYSGLNMELISRVSKGDWSALVMEKKS